MVEQLTREEFRNSCLKRDGYKCVFCGETENLAVHHIIERRLFGESQGYFESNGATVCEFHHLECEKTLISPQEARDACKISTIILPEHFYHDNEYSKWGDIILNNGMRSKGELFYDENVQKILRAGGVLNLYTDQIKHPRTFHTPWSASVGKDDKVLKSMDSFVGKRVIVTEKLDGESTSLYTNYYHARSLDSVNHPSRNWTKARHAQFAHDIPQGWRLVVENVYAKHALAYDNLESFIYGIFVWNDRNECLSWDETVEWFNLFDLPHVPVIYDDIFNESRIRSIKLDETKQEGYVIRIADQFPYGAFRKSVAKYVRRDHVSDTVHNWQMERMIPNKLKK